MMARVGGAAPMLGANEARSYPTQRPGLAGSAAGGRFQGPAVQSRNPSLCWYFRHCPCLRLSQFPLFTAKETPADAEIPSHRLMLAGRADLANWDPASHLAAAPACACCARVEQIILA